LVELVFYGRGGQGAVTAARLLVGAAHKEGLEGQAFPHFGAERRGAPVRAYARISDKPIRVHEEVRRPDVVVVLDPGLPKLVDITRGLKEGGVIVINSKKPERFDSYTVYVVDATGIALELGLVVAGWPVVNTSMLGALARATGLVKLSSVMEEIKSYCPGRIGEVNARAAELAYERVRRVE
jgi:pyruvate ferredoxin oxidoreductase gamma subunit